MKYTKMNRRQLLAAETFSYSYANYADHLGIGNVRFDELMPHDVDVLEIADREGWNISKLSEELEIDKEHAENLLKSYQRAKEVVFARNAAESYRIGVRQSIENALEDGLSTKEDIERLVEQICYRAADFAYLLDLENKELSDYSESLRGHDEIVDE